MARPDFVIKSYDKLAVRTINFWIQMAIVEGVNRAKIERALLHLETLTKWQEDHQDEMKLPD